MQGTLTRATPWLQTQRGSSGAPSSAFSGSTLHLLSRNPVLTRLGSVGLLTRRGQRQAWLPGGSAGQWEGAQEKTGSVTPAALGVGLGTAGWDRLSA